MARCNASGITAQALIMCWWCCWQRLLKGTASAVWGEFISVSFFTFDVVRDWLKAEIMDGLQTLRGMLLRQPFDEPGYSLTRILQATHTRQKRVMAARQCWQFWRAIVRFVWACAHRGRLRSRSVERARVWCRHGGPRFDG